MERTTLPTPTRPPSDDDAPAQAELGKTEVEMTEAWAAEAMAMADTSERRSMLAGKGGEGRFV